MGGIQKKIVQLLVADKVNRDLDLVWEEC